MTGRGVTISMATMLSGWLMIVLCAAAMLVFSTQARAEIVLQRGIAGVRLSMKAANVIGKKGRPDSDRNVPNEILGQQRVMRYGKTKVAFNGTGNRARVSAVITRSHRQRTAEGIGVGSRESALKKANPKARCRTEYGFRHCTIGNVRPGARVTEFRIKRRTDRVKQVTVGIVID